MKILHLLYIIPSFNKLRCFLVRRKVAKEYKLRSSVEIMNMKNEIYDSMLVAGRTKNNELVSQCQAQLNFIEWLTGGKSDPC